MDGSRRRTSATFCLERFTSLGECAIRICQLPIVDGFLAMRRHYQEEAAHGCQQLDSRPLAPSCLPSVVVPHRDGQSHRLQLSLSAVMREYVCPAVRQRAR